MLGYVQPEEVHMRRSHQLTAGVVALALFTSGCYGPFLLTKKVHEWNGQVSDNRWVVEVVFLVCEIGRAHV